MKVDVLVICRLDGRCCMHGGAQMCSVEGCQRVRSMERYHSSTTLYWLEWLIFLMAVRGDIIHRGPDSMGGVLCMEVM